MKKVMCAVSVLAAIALVGCGAKKTIYHHDDPNNPTRVTSTEIIETSGFESENLETVERERTNRVNALLEIHKATEYDSPTSSTLGGVLFGMMAQQMSQGPLPRTMVDLGMAVLPALIQAVPNYWMAFGGDDWGSRKGSPSLGDITESIVIWESDLGTGPYSQSRFNFGEIAEFDFEVSGESSGTFDGSGMFDTSRSSSQSRSESYVESPRKDDSSLF
jgi:hypothetical protein